MIETPPVLSTPCPFCASVDLFMTMNEESDSTTLFFLRCNSCQAEGPRGDSLHSAAVLWDRSGLTRRRPHTQSEWHPLYPAGE